MEVRALTGADGQAILAWRYPGRYSTYDFDDPSALDSDTWAVTDGGELIGYCCFGAPARVPGAGEEPGVLDVGYGLAPELMGRGLGPRFVGHDPRVRARPAWPGAGAPLRARLERAFQEGRGGARLRVESTLESDEGRFLVMVRRGTGAPAS